jgi:hypothetical protein
VRSSRKITQPLPQRAQLLFAGHDALISNSLGAGGPHFSSRHSENSKPSNSEIGYHHESTDLSRNWRAPSMSCQLCLVVAERKGRGPGGTGAATREVSSPQTRYDEVLICQKRDCFDKHEFIR